ncbi:O-antigen polymerase [Robertkochia sediminum]|uniref:O-antigen polymerase n=1 Tax=Robertkochia sediminum TaxID=2785326 RepID=UPI001931FE8E|nr:O-antigen polymerase [Robertkochia sediminum]MBL7471757.1 O-antigen polysaccharide polymerase Wzy [Robertkochia sediminum]
MKIKLATLFPLIFAGISFVLFLLYSGPIKVLASFIFNFVVVFFITWYHLNNERNHSPFLSSYLIFSSLFLFFAPVIQITNLQINGGKFPNGFPFNDSLIIYINLLIVLFHIVFFISYIYFSSRLMVKLKRRVNISRNFPLLVMILLGVALLIAVFNWNYLITEMVRPNWSELQESVAMFLVRKKVLFLVPLGIIIICSSYLKSGFKVNVNYLTVLFVCIISILLLLFFKNPLTEKRNALGPIYITLIFLFFPRLLNSNLKSYSFLFFALILGFPLMAVITHIDATFDEMIGSPGIFINYLKHEGVFKTFNTLHYDAFANIMATIDYVSVNGLTYGFQLLSALFFFIPRSLWPAKPISTGELIGNYLISDYDFVFNNLSNPLISEGYVNFGLFGVVLFAILLGYFGAYSKIWLLEFQSPLLKSVAFYSSIHLIFLLRGDLTNGFAYLCGSLIGFYFIPKFFNFFVSRFRL